MIYWERYENKPNLFRCLSCELQTTFWLISVSKRAKSKNIRSLFLCQFRLNFQFLVFHRGWIDYQCFPFSLVYFCNHQINGDYSSLVLFLVLPSLFLHRTCCASLLMLGIDLSACIIILQKNTTKWKQYQSEHCEHQAPTEIQNEQWTFHISGFPLLQEKVYAQFQIFISYCSIFHIVRSICNFGIELWLLLVSLILSNCSEGRHSFLFSLSFLSANKCNFRFHFKQDISSMMILKWRIHHFWIDDSNHLHYFHLFVLLFICWCANTVLQLYSLTQRDCWRCIHFAQWCNWWGKSFLAALLLYLVRVILLQDKLDSFVWNELATTKNFNNARECRMNEGTNKCAKWKKKRLESWLLFMI